MPPNIKRPANNVTIRNDVVAMIRRVSTFRRRDILFHDIIGHIYHVATSSQDMDDRTRSTRPRS
ncbi:hypothetical protein SXCC_00736 [Gluconacetobacter sp. SXCC-1]|nr:hypothetical protein SXCC_00736 [Gluconacetobacter sp. SXCC-1]